MTDSVESVLQKSREEFEKWAKRPSLPLKREFNAYTEYLTQLAWMAWQASRSALEPILAELKGKQVGPGSRNVPEIPLICFHCGKHVPLAFNQCTDCKEAAEQALCEAQADSENLRELLRRLFDDTKWPACAADNHRKHRLLTEVQQALSPSPTPAQDKSRCSVCGCSRVVVTRERPVKYGACSFIECADPLKDYRAEDALLAKPSPDSATPEEKK